MFTTNVDHGHCDEPCGSASPSCARPTCADEATREATREDGRELAALNAHLDA